MRIRLVIHRWRASFIRWLNTPPKQDDWFFVHIRKTKQQLFPCQHEECSATDLWHRICLICGKRQRLFIDTKQNKSYWVDEV